MGCFKRLALWGCAMLMAVTAVAVGEADPAWATNPTDTADAPGGEAAAGGGTADASAAPSDPRLWGVAEAAGLRPAGRSVAGRSMVVLASSHCQHGQWSSGRCRACPVGQVWITGTGCVVATDPRQCSSGNTWLEPHGCRPTNCSYGRTSAGFCRSAPSCRSGDHPKVSHWHPTGSGHRTCQVHTTTQTCGTWSPGAGHSTQQLGTSGDHPKVSHWHPTGSGHRTCQVHTTTQTCGTWSPGAGHSTQQLGTCLSDCPAGKIRLPLAFGTRCVPANCTHGYTPAGTCRVCPLGQTQLAAFGTRCVLASCTYGYTSTGACEAASPTHRYTALKCTTYSADASAREYLDAYNDKKLDRATCPPRELFLANTGTDDWPTWGFQKSVADNYGKIVVEESGDCSGGLPDTGAWWDFQVPCKAHDHCFDLRRAGFSVTVTDGGCDDLLAALMIADCNNRSKIRILFFPSPYDACLTQSGLIRGVQTVVNQGPNPGPVKIVNVKIGKCASVKGSLQTDGTKVVQQTCSSSSSQQFRLYQTGRYNGYFLIKPVHSNKCIEVVSVSLAQMSCLARRPTVDRRWAKQAFRLNSVSNSDIYQVRSKSLSSSCWTIPYTVSSRNSIKPVVDNVDGTQLTNVNCASSKDSQKWSIRSASYTPPPATTATTTTTALPPTTTAVPGAPSGLSGAGRSGSGSGGGSIVLSWSDPGDSSITGYQYKIRHPATQRLYGSWTAISGSGASTTGHTITGLANRNRYNVKLRALNSAGAGPETVVFSVWTNPVVPGAPSGLSGAGRSGSGSGGGSIVLSWSDPGDSSITGYQYKIRHPATQRLYGSWTAISGSGASTTGHTITGLANRNRYNVKLRALNSAGAGPETVVFSVWTNPATTSPGP